MKKQIGADHDGFGLQMSLKSLVIFSMSLTVATGGVVFFATSSLTSHSGIRRQPDQSLPARENLSAPATSPPWGELITYDMEIEQPDEYIASQADTNRVPTWFFDGLSVENVRALLLNCGLTAEQIERVCAPERLIRTATNTILKPDADLVLALSPETRGNLYSQLAASPNNQYMYFPASFPGNSFDLTMLGSAVDEPTISLIRQLLYKRGNSTFFSDFETVMPRVPSEEQRRSLLKALSRQPGLLVRLRIRPTTDVDKLLHYWTQAPGVRLIDLRPLLESIRRLPDGGSISLLYFLPKFARERLYTYPLPPKAGDRAMDCHWSTMNFFNEEPDDRLGDPAHVGQRLMQDYYVVQRPSNYGDIVVLADANGAGIHSAVYIADDIVFTKNGNNHLQPWMLMRLNNLLERYSIRGMPRTVVYRKKSE